MIRAALVALILSQTLASPPLAEDGPNMTPADPGPAGAVRITALAWQLYALGLDREDPLILLTAIRLARASDMRAATGWALASPDQPEAAPAAPSGLPRDPTSEPALSLAILMAEGDPDLADLAADIEADLTLRPATNRISMATSVLAGGTQEEWRIPFYGQSPAELAVISEGAAGLGLRVTDETGVTVCLRPRPDNLCFCAFTPARNGYFLITVTNESAETLSYRLLSN